MKYSRLRRRRKKKRKSQEGYRQTRIRSNTSRSRRKRVRMLEDWGKPNAKFYGRFLWKPPDSEKYSSKCEACEEKRTACFAVSNQFLSMTICEQHTVLHYKIV